MSIITCGLSLPDAFVRGKICFAHVLHLEWLFVSDTVVFAHDFVRAMAVVRVEACFAHVPYSLRLLLRAFIESVS